MRSKSLCVAAGCILFAVFLIPIFSSGASPSVTTAKEQILHSFAGGTDGAYPQSDLTLDSEGNLYGTTYEGGETSCVYRGETWSGCGTVFELKPTADGWAEEILYRFNVNDNSGGALPAGGVTFDKAGNLYGTTEGLPNNCNEGNVFKLTHDSLHGWGETVLYTFNCGSSGYNPHADLVFDSKGDLFGIASDAIFELIPQANGSWKEVTVHQFTGGPDGATPASGLVLDSSDNIYGTTMSGGTGRCYYYQQGCGIVYKLTPGPDGNWTETVLYNFVRGGGFGVNPSGGLILEGPGHFFVTTVAGGDGLGTVAELTQGQKGWEQRVLHRFYGDPDGNIPIGKTEINSGAGFGVTSRGGTSGMGTVFGLQRSATNSWREIVLHSFAGGSDGSYPAAGLVFDSHGNLYGTTPGGGTGTKCGGSGCRPAPLCGGDGCGTVYEITP